MAQTMTPGKKPSNKKPESTTEPTKRVNFFIPVSQYGGLARLAGEQTARAGERVTMTDIIIQAIGEYMERNK